MGDVFGEIEKCRGAEAGAFELVLNMSKNSINSFGFVVLEFFSKLNLSIRSTFWQFCGIISITQGALRQARDGIGVIADKVRFNTVPGSSKFLPIIRFEIMVFSIALLSFFAFALAHFSAHTFVHKLLVLGVKVVEYLEEFHGRFWGDLVQFTIGNTLASGLNETFISWEGHDGTSSKESNGKTQEEKGGDDDVNDGAALVMALSGGTKGDNTGNKHGEDCQRGEHRSNDLEWVDTFHCSSFFRCHGLIIKTQHRVHHHCKSFVTCKRGSVTELNNSNDEEDNAGHHDGDTCLLRDSS